MAATEVDNVLIETLRRHFCQTEKFALGAEWFGERKRTLRPPWRLLLPR